jgi:transcriptional regulator with XRE-family HTH domain
MITSQIDVHIGQKLRTIRISAKMSQEQVGELLGVSLQQIQKYEICANRISASKLYEFAKIFNVSINYFFDDYLSDKDFHDCKSGQKQTLIDAFNKINSNKVKDDIIKLINSISQL